MVIGEQKQIRKHWDAMNEEGYFSAEMRHQGVAAIRHRLVRKYGRNYQIEYILHFSRPLPFSIHADSRTFMSHFDRASLR